MRLDEYFGYHTESAVDLRAENDIQIATGNDLIGAQIGWQMQFLVYPRRWIDVELKGGIFNNSVSLATSYVRADDTGTFRHADGDRQDRTSYVNDLSVVYNHQITRHFTLRVGYNAFWVWQVALATQNLGRDINPLAFGPVSARHDGEVVYHGPNLGLAWAW